MLPCQNVFCTDKAKIRNELFIWLSWFFGLNCRFTSFLEFAFNRLSKNGSLLKLGNKLYL